MVCHLHDVSMAAPTSTSRSFSSAKTINLSIPLSKLFIATNAFRNVNTFLLQNYPNIFRCFLKIWYFCHKIPYFEFIQHGLIAYTFCKTFNYHCTNVNWPMHQEISIHIDMLPIFSIAAIMPKGRMIGECCFCQVCLPVVNFNIAIHFATFFLHKSQMLELYCSVS